MPIPTPRNGESEDQFIDRCVTKLLDDEAELPPEEAVAICYTKWQKKELSKSFYKLMVELYEIAMRS